MLTQLTQWDNIIIYINSKRSGGEKMRRDLNSIEEGRKEIVNIYETLSEPLQLHILSTAHLLITTQELVLQSKE